MESNSQARSFSNSDDGGTGMTENKDTNAKLTADFRLSQKTNGRIVGIVNSNLNNLVASTTELLVAHECISPEKFKFLLNEFQDKYELSDDNLSDITRTSIDTLDEWKTGQATPASFKRKSILLSILHEQGISFDSKEIPGLSMATIAR